MILRHYQRAAVDAVYEHLRTRDDNPCVVLPTGAGKTPVIGTIVSDAVTLWNGRVLVLAHVKELLEQNIEKIKAICPGIEVGAYSAGLGRRDTKYQAIVAGIQSVYKRACELDKFDLIIIDEAHLIPPAGDGMYRQFLNDMKVINPNVRVIGLTATAFRTKDGSICAPGGVLNHICYEIGVKQLIDEGFLSKLHSKEGGAVIDTSRVAIRGGEFVADQLEAAADDDGLVTSAVQEIVTRTKDIRKATLIFATGVQHGQHIVDTLRDKHGIECGFVTGNTSPETRKAILDRFRGKLTPNLIDAGPLRYLCNVNVLTTGFDAPHIDCVALLRPTMSPGLYYQMVGRGFRLAEDKLSCLILDFGGNVERHGPVDKLVVKQKAKRKSAEPLAPPEKRCPTCKTVWPASQGICVRCGYLFPPPDRNTHEPEATTAGVISGQETVRRMMVKKVGYKPHQKDDKPPSMRVEYQVGLTDYKCEWVCFEHGGRARKSAEEWWARRCKLPCPKTTEEAIQIALAGGLAATFAIQVREIAGEPHKTRITQHELGIISEPEEVLF